MYLALSYDHRIIDGKEAVTFLKTVKEMLEEPARMLSSIILTFQIIMAKNTSFDLIVIGAGPGGYVAAIRGAQLGLSTALVEKDSNLGGTCLKWAVFLVRFLLHSTELFHHLNSNGAEHGIVAMGLSLILQL